MVEVTSEYSQVNGVRLHYVRAGSGRRAVVLTHGNSHCGGVWRPLVQALAGEDLTVIATDLRGHGWSDKPESGFHWSDLRDDVAGLVRALDLPEVVFVSHSRGGGVALLAAAALPEQVRGVLAFEPTVPVQAGADGRPAPAPGSTRTHDAAQRARRRRQVFPDRQALIDRYRAQDAFREWRDDYWQAFLDYGSLTLPDGTVELCMPPRTAALLLEATFEFDAWREVHCPTLPVQLVYGERSGRLGGGDPAAGIRTMFPRAEVTVMAHATHTGPMEQPERFEALVRAFLSQVWPAE